MAMISMDPILKSKYSMCTCMYMYMYVCVCVYNVFMCSVFYIVYISIVCYNLISLCIYIYITYYYTYYTSQSHNPASTIIQSQLYTI